MADKLILVKAGPEWRSALLDIAEEYAAHGEARYQMARADCDGYLQMLAADDAGTTPGHVRMTSYWAMEAGLMVGSIRLRYTLTPALRQVGGNIGYDVRPSRRNQGYATRMLALMLARAREVGLERVLLTVDVDNIASARVIEKNGGVLQFQGTFEGYDEPIAHYWIQLAGGLPVRGEHDL
jgi:predicted acetyltransferase